MFFIFMISCILRCINIMLMHLNEHIVKTFECYFHSKSPCILISNNAGFSKSVFLWLHSITRYYRCQGLLSVNCELTLYQVSFAFVSPQSYGTSDYQSLSRICLCSNLVHYDSLMKR